LNWTFSSSGSLNIKSAHLKSSSLMRHNLRRLNMYARNVSFRLKSNMQSDYTRTFENQILPLLQKQKGFKDEITLCNPGSADAISISLWENKKNADDYNTNTYPEVLKTLAKVVDGTPQVHTFETVISTFHHVPVTV